MLHNILTHEMCLSTSATVCQSVSQPCLACQGWNGLYGNSGLGKFNVDPGSQA